jgi:hypothetical protein
MPYPARVASRIPAFVATETAVDGYGANVPVNAETPIDWARTLRKTIRFILLRGRRYMALHVT